MSSLSALFETNPFDFSPENRSIFIESFREASECHYNGSALFRSFWNEAKLSPAEIKNEESLLRVPPILVTLFKERELLSIPRDKVVLKLTSSGTSGQKSQIFLDQDSLNRVKRLAYQIHRYLGMVADHEVNYLCFTYDPRFAKDLGTAFTDELLTSFTKKHEVYYAIQWDADRGEFVLNRGGVVEALKRFNADKRPTRVLGFPAHLYMILRDFNLRLSLGEESWVQTGGGWKGLAGAEIPKAEFRRFVSESLGIPIGHIRDMFGMVEHGIPYCDCSAGNLHVPNYARVFIRSPLDLSVLPDGAVGLMHLLCSYNTSYPSISLLTTDWARLGHCACGMGGQTLEILGRAGTSKHKGCAIAANQLLERR